MQALAAQEGGTPTASLTRNARKLFDRYNFLKSLNLSDHQMVAAIIQEALMLTGGNAVDAFGLVYEIRNSLNGIHDNDLWASADHFFQSWTLRNHVRTGLLAGIGAGFVNDGYAILKSIGFPVGRDNPNVPPSPVTWQQYFWGNKGSWAAFWYSTNLSIGSPEWRDFLKWLDKWAGRPVF